MRPDVKVSALKIKKHLVGAHTECGGLGYVQGEHGVQDCLCMQIFDFVIELLYSRIPRMYWLQTLDSLDGIEELYREYVKLFVNKIHSAVDNGLGMLFMGPNGVGKTSLQTYIGREALIQGYSVRYFTLERYIMAAREGDDEFLADCDSAQVILLDEIDKAYTKKGSDFTAKRTEEFIRRIISEGRVLIVCTNFDEDRLVEEFGESLYSMLQRRLRFVPMDGDDYSGAVQDQWRDLLESKFNYFDDALVSQTKRYLGVL